MKTSIVIGVGYGDEGKGLVTSFLTDPNEETLVVRFSGGHQAGHTVVKDGFRHVFSSFGAGTLNGADSYISKYCTFSPRAVLNEYAHLKAGGYSPKLYVHPLCPVTTPFDMLYNQQTELDNVHGSCGVGFGATIARQEAYYKLYVQDLFYEDVYNHKLKNIIDYYKSIGGVFNANSISSVYDKFIDEIESVKTIINTKINFDDYKHVIFEGSQGILLDMDFGFFPNVTRSNTTSKNALYMCNQYGLANPEIYYVTRCYQTRHGNGFMTNEHIKLELVNNQYETNVEDTWQGKFRVAPIDTNLINYALDCDNNFSNGVDGKHLVITCLDQLVVDKYAIIDKINTKFNKIYLSHSPRSGNIRELKQVI